MRCRHCGRSLRDTDSLRRGVGPECLTKTSSPRSRRLDALRSKALEGGQDAEYASLILDRLNEGRRLSDRQERFLNLLLASAAADALDAEVPA